ncbi:glycosyltransferase family 4 protein [Corynebacterium mayonis]|uniref:glycosyltransferase family 4 protein n=1 Tax=Corynebacterium mayonis TaxID=3062461 RepID=UPI0031401931
MEILVVSQYWYPENGVPQRRWTWLAEVLHNQGHRVTVIAPPPGYDRKISFDQWLRTGLWKPTNIVETGPSDERIARSGSFPNGTSLTSRAIAQAFIALCQLVEGARLRKVLDGYRPDVIIGTVPALPSAFVARLLAKYFRVPYVIDLRDAWPDLLQQSDSWNAGLGRKSMRQKILSLGPLQIIAFITQHGLNNVLRNSDAIISTSEELSVSLGNRAAIKRGDQMPYIATVRNVFPAKTVVQKKSRPTQPDNTLHILYAGTMGRSQDLQNAIEAVRVCKNRGCRVELRLVGAGAAKPTLQKLSKELGTLVTFERRHPAESLNEHYAWADTALVHLADWKPLTRTVPSKLYELMQVGLHISCVARGESAELTRQLRAGDVVEPNSPHELADLWISLSSNRSRLLVDSTGAQWVKKQRDDIVPSAVRSLLDFIQTR